MRRIQLCLSSTRTNFRVQIIGVSIVYHETSASLAFVGGIHRSPVHSPHKRLVTQKMFSYDDVIMIYTYVIDRKMRPVCH